jgi:integrase/recombinase XerD
MTPRSVQKAFKLYAEEAGVPWAHVHTLRTTHITHHLAAGTDIRTVQHNAGHSNLATTNRYAAYVKEAAIKAMQEHAL